MLEMYEIEDGIPLPDALAGALPALSVPLRAMACGQSVLCRNEGINSVVARARREMRHALHEGEIKRFVCRRVAGVGVRVWRVE